MILVVAERDAARACKTLDRLREPWRRIGRVVPLKRGAKSRVTYL